MLRTSHHDSRSSTRVPRRNPHFQTTGLLGEPSKRSSTPKPISGCSARVVLDPLAADAVAARRQYVGHVVKAYRPTTAVHAAMASDAWPLTNVLYGADPDRHCPHSRVGAPNDHFGHYPTLVTARKLSATSSRLPSSESTTT